MLRKTEVKLNKNSGEITNTVTGRIHSVYIDSQKYEFFPDFEKFLLNKNPARNYSVFNDKFLFPLFESDKTIEVIYYTNNFAKNYQGEDKPKMVNKDDSPIIPEPFLEPILVYGTCMRLKGNTENNKFSYWYGMYKDSLANMRSKIGTSAFETPSIKIRRH